MAAIGKWLVQVKLYSSSRSIIRVDSAEGEEFAVNKCTVHKGSVLSPLLFILVYIKSIKRLELDCPRNCCMQIIWS